MYSILENCLKMRIENNKVNINSLKYITKRILNNTYIVSLVDAKGFAITVGYGDSLEEAINDLHSNLI